MQERDRREALTPFPSSLLVGNAASGLNLSPPLVGTWQSVRDWWGLTSFSPRRLRLYPEDGSGWLATGEFIPKRRVAAIQSLACFWNKEVPNFKAVGCYSQIPSETLALAADGGVSPEH